MAEDGTEIIRHSCPNCGGDLAPRDLVRCRTLVCPSCGAQLRPEDTALAQVGMVDLAAHPPRGPLRLGLFLQLEGDVVEVIGRIRYGGEAWSWDEWLLRGERGRHLWLSEDGQRYVLYRHHRPKTPIPMERLLPKSTVDLDGRPLRVEEIGVVAILFFEGELTWRANLGEEITYVDLRDGQIHYSIEASEEEIRFFKGRLLSPGKVAALVGVQEDPPPAPPPGVADWRSYSPASEGIVPMVLWGLFGLFVFWILAIRPVDAGTARLPEGRSGKATAGRSVRRGSLFVRGYWGGFRRGK